MVSLLSFLVALNQLSPAASECGESDAAAAAVPFKGHYRYCTVLYCIVSRLHSRRGLLASSLKTLPHTIRWTLFRCACLLP